MSDSTTKTSPLHDKHVELGAKMADFGGWSMPIEYPGGGVVAEHAAVRQRVGLFDVSHLGTAEVTGAGAKDFLNSCFTNDLDRIEPGRAQYTMCCDENGGVVDDLIVYLRSEEDLLLIPNAANTAEVLRRLTEAAPEGITVDNTHGQHAIMAVQGPKADEVLQSLGLPTGHSYMSFVDAEWEGHPMTVCRTGYTGERGYELVCAVEDASALWDAVVSAMEPFDGMACGLGSRDTLRTEMGYPLHGNDLSLDITPVMARAAWSVGWDKESFWGKEALAAQRAAKESRLSRGLLVTGRGIPRPGYAVLDADGNTIGEVTSGTFSPTLKQGIALALLDRGVQDGQEVTIDVRGRQIAAEVKKPPFVEGGAGS
ncbi:glycine cleavage system aminomethyltransferase GcvT [Ornithinimicrobium avium]|uniref:Aminomethyltransferase n=1 Tax=Ornithinimicrobium avium TaxID=2283195 RepID=A0A345NKP9_9MICO|nr:glycine cleavage system aminomethyltransferase GcvT [Ornithinimicrobium avium]AXH95607.1 glycine cleavage system aminomethyltransferase GcvT [Ornithinimicrobium avium]